MFAFWKVAEVLQRYGRDVTLSRAPIHHSRRRTIVCSEIGQSHGRSHFVLSVYREGDDSITCCDLCNLLRVVLRQETL